MKGRSIKYNQTSGQKARGCIVSGMPNTSGLAGALILSKRQSSIMKSLTFAKQRLLREICGFSTYVVHYSTEISGRSRDVAVMVLNITAERFCQKVKS